jgi:hypothetical protein
MTTQPHPEPSEEASSLPVPRSIEGLMRGEPDAEDFGIPSEFATRAENYARWVATQSLKVAMPSELPNCVAALSSAKREAEPLTDAKVIAMNPYLNDEGRRALWLAAFRMAEKHHGITAASQVEPEDKHG